MVIKVLRLLALVLVLNIARYLVAPVLEVPLIFEGLFGAMAANPQHFNSDFTSWDFLTSYASTARCAAPIAPAVIASAIASELAIAIPLVARETTPR